MVDRGSVDEDVGSIGAIEMGVGPDVSGSPGHRRSRGRAQRPGGADLWTVAMATGVALTAVTYAFGQVSGGHFNPVVTIGLVAGGRFELAHAPGFVIAQLIGAGLAAAFVVANSRSR